MKKIFLLLLFAVFGISGYAQSINNSKAEETLRFEYNKSVTTKILIISTTSYPASTFRNFKKELQGWSSKVISSYIDTIQQTFTLTHNALLDDQEFQEFLKKYSIKSNTIISYN